MTVKLSTMRDLARREYEEYLGTFLRDSPVVARRGEPDVADLLFGDPHDSSLPEIAGILQSQVEESQRQGYQYIHHLPEAREAAAHQLSVRTKLNFSSDALFLNTGAFSGLQCCLQVLCDANTEVLYLSPPWFYYRSMIKAVGAVPRGINLNRKDWSIPFDELAASIGQQTSAVLINSPHNPTGKVFSDEELAQLAEILSDASQRLGRDIPLISDEAYARIVLSMIMHPHPPSTIPQQLLSIPMEKRCWPQA
ncbi:MAG: aminotransferase class I/II-fold pyridoxal phosphate-dependent enzyme [Acaryochloris sp. RU_4_1]|nr:aminotransferase class I/II-fold pyridoxal phosphate-dependent enzyme [Acaryochloris sp. RU_4_1]